MYRGLLLLLLLILLLLLFNWLRVATAACNAANGLMGYFGTGTERHTLHQGAAETTKHSRAGLLCSLHRWLLWLSVNGATGCC
jgi:hypothetical protein